MKQLALYISGNHLYFGNPVNLITEEFHSQRRFGRISRRKYLNHVSPHPKLVSYEINIVSFVLYFHKLFYKLVPANLGAFSDGNDVGAVILRTSQRINAGYAGYDYNVSALRQSKGSRVP